MKNVPFSSIDAHYDVTFFCAKVIGATSSEGFLVSTTTVQFLVKWTSQSLTMHQTEVPYTDRLDAFDNHSSP